MILASGTSHAATINVNNSTPNAIGTAIGTASSGDTLNLSAGTYNEHDITITKNLTITGPVTNDTPTAIIDAQQQGRVLNINSGITSNLIYLTIQNGKATYGGGIYNSGTVTVTNSNINNNTATFGGSIYNTGTFTVTNSEINNNTATNYGGGIYNTGTFTVTGTKSTINDNNASNGGGIYNIGTCGIINSEIDDNTATNGGGIWAGGNVNVAYSNINNNTSIYGGGIYNPGNITVTNSEIDDNTATNYGGGICNPGTFTVTNSEINNNTATNYGGGIYNSGAFTVANSEIDDNNATNGGGIYNIGTCGIINSEIDDNTATNYGGGIYNNNNTVTITGCDFESNRAALIGNSIYNVGTGSTVIMHFNRLYDIAPGYEIYNYVGDVNAQYNWWGSNSNPVTKISGTGIDTSSWLVLTANADPVFIGGNGVSNITANLWFDSNGTYHNPASGHVLNGIPLTFYSTIGIINTPITTINGSVTSTLTAGTVSGIADIYAILDDQFTETAVILDVTPPTITIIDPVNDTAINNTSKVVKVTLNEVVQKSAAFNNISISLNGTPISITTTLNGNVLTINNSKNYVDGIYTVNIPINAVVDAAGNPINNYTSIFTVDTIDPTVNTVDPSNNAVINNAGKIVNITLNETVQKGATFNNITITHNGTNISITSALNGKVLTLTNTGNYADGTYTINIPTNALMDAAGNPISNYTSIFTLDTIDPTANANPVGGLYNTTKNVALTMNEQGSIYYTTNGTNPTIQSTLYTNPINITNTTTLKFIAYDLAGNNSPIYTETYTIDTKPPVVSTSNPTNGKTAVKRSQIITITFNKNILAGSNYSKITLKSSTGKTITITKSISGKVLTIKHSTLAAKTKYTLTLYSGSIKDQAGNPIATKTITFTTGNT